MWLVARAISSLRWKVLLLTMAIGIIYSVNSVSVVLT